MNGPRTLITPIRFMQEYRQREDGANQSFGAFLRTCVRKVLALLLLALAVRVVFIVAFPDPLQETRYRTIAVNILEGNGFSSDAAVLVSAIRGLATACSRAFESLMPRICQGVKGMTLQGGDEVRSPSRERRREPRRSTCPFQPARNTIGLSICQYGGTESASSSVILSGAVAGFCHCLPR